MKVTNNTASNGGVGFCGLLTICFIVLKHTHVIDWPWVWVLAPTWIPAILVILLAVLRAWFD